MPKIPTPNLLEVEGRDGTFVMDCDSGIALISLRRERTRAVRKTAIESEEELELAPVQKVKTSAN